MKLVIIYSCSKEQLPFFGFAQQIHQQLNLPHTVKHAKIKESNTAILQIFFLAERNFI